MAYKNIEDSRAAIRRHYYANKQYYVEKASRRKKDIRELVILIKKLICCQDCGINYPYYVMDFDHIGVKRNTINSLIERCSVKNLEEEMSNCELVCANCHRFRTYKRMTAASSIL